MSTDALSAEFLNTEELQSWITRIRGGDQLAAAELLKHYEPEVRRFIRYRLTEPRLRRVLDSVDICQSVMASFFIHLQSGTITVEHPLQLMKLLNVMARNALLDHYRRAKVRAVVAGNLAIDSLEQVAGNQDSPHQLVERADLISELRNRMTEGERLIFDRWLGGDQWQALSSEFECKPDTLRKRMTRAIDRAMRELGLSKTME